MGTYLYIVRIKWCLGQYWYRTGTIIVRIRTYDRSYCCIGTSSSVELLRRRRCDPIEIVLPVIDILYDDIDRGQGADHCLRHVL